MAVTGLDHFAILSSDEERTTRFYTEVVGLRVGFRPPDLSFPGVWLYAGDTPIVHVVFGRPIPSVPTGAVDHLSFRAEGDADEMAALLQSRGIEFSKRTLERTGITQIFCRDPDNVGVELNYPRVPVASTGGRDRPS
jgi:catechol 2,3-dioxygenase-like lactoylglutathione lyase family enzyme